MGTPEGRQPCSARRSRNCAATRRALSKVSSRGSQPGRRDLEDIYADAVIMLTCRSRRDTRGPGRARRAERNDAQEGGAAFFQNSTRIPAGKSKNIGAHHNIVLKALQGVAKPRSGPLRFGNWQVTERLRRHLDAYVEYRAFNAYRRAEVDRAHSRVPGRPVQAAVRNGRSSAASSPTPTVRSAPCRGIPASSACASSSRRRARTSFYPLSPRTFPDRALRVHIEKPTLALTLDQKIQDRATIP